MKKISLALGGGAARGLAHIGVYKYLEEQNTEITEISGTSMGAIIGAMIAIGMNSKEIEDFAKSFNMLKMADFDLKSGLLKGNKVEEKLKQVFGVKKIEETSIPLKIIATNVGKAESKVFDSGLIVNAIRASLSLPGIFVPKQIDEEAYVDGGIMMNLPIEVLDGENILAISALKINTGNIVKQKEFLGIKFKSGFWQNNYETIKRSVILMMKVNEDNSLKTPNKNITLIRPNFGKLDIMDFGKVDEFIKIGYEEMKKEHPLSGILSPSQEKEAA